MGKKWFIYNLPEMSFSDFSGHFHGVREVWVPKGTA